MSGDSARSAASSIRRVSVYICVCVYRLLYLRRTTEGDYNTLFNVSKQRHAVQLGERSHSGRSHDVLDVVDKKRDCFLLCFVQNI